MSNPNANPALQETTVTGEIPAETAGEAAGADTTATTGDLRVTVNSKRSGFAS